MNRNQARALARQGITRAELRDCLIRARKEIQDWRAPSKTNPLFSLGASFNIFWRGISRRGISVSETASSNILRDFGEYGPWVPDPTLKPSPPRQPVHEEPVDIEELP